MGGWAGRCGEKEYLIQHVFKCSLSRFMYIYIQADRPNVNIRIEHSKTEAPANVDNDIIDEPGTAEEEEGPAAHCQERIQSKNLQYS